MGARPVLNHLKLVIEKQIYYKQLHDIRDCI